MTETALVALLTLMCSGNKEQKIECYEKYVNCAVNSSGILSKQKFIERCTGVQNEQSNSKRFKIDTDGN